MVTAIPSKLEDWDIHVLNELIRYKDIESESFDFKGTEINKLYKDICAIANTNGGFIVLGIEEERTPDSKKLLGFKKVGFEDGQEDYVNREIGNSVLNIEPNPTVKTKNIQDKDNERFYAVLEIKHETSKKPLFIKNKGQCYVRIGSISAPASRSIILNLFSYTIERRQSVASLQTATVFVKEALLHLSNDVRFVGSDAPFKIAKIDLTFLRNAALNAEWFLIENNLLGRHTESGGVEVGLYYFLHEVDTLNTYIDAYNNRLEKEKFTFPSYFQSWQTGSSSTANAVQFLDKIIKTANGFLAKYK